MLEYATNILATMEGDPKVSTRRDVITGLRKLGLSDFGEVLWSMPNRDYPKLSRLLPAMASEEVQRSWTGCSGLDLLKQTTAFVRTMASVFTHVTGRPLNGATVLDFGCGYGRITRLLYYFIEEDRFFAVDPWEESLNHCRASGLGANLFLSDYLPGFLPVGDVKFDLIFAFSVFTHLSHRAASTALKTLRRYVADDGMLAITIRPIEYWHHDPGTSPDQKAFLIASHRAQGFAFNPHDREPVDGDITYGDASMTCEWLARSFPEWRISGTDRSFEDVFQRYVLMVPC